MALPETETAPPGNMEADVAPEVLQLSVELPTSLMLAGLAAKLQGLDRVTVCFFGEGAANEGTFHESVNLASVWRLPVVYVCENNLYAVTTPVRDAVSVKEIADRGAAYGIPGVSVDGQDVLAVYEAAGAAVDRARQGKGPSLIECRTYRYLGHFVTEELLLGDKSYRPNEEIDEWKARDPVTIFETRLVDMGVLTKDKAAAIEEDIRARLEEAVTFARQSPLPAPEEALEDLFA